MMAARGLSRRVYDHLSNGCFDKKDPRAVQFFLKYERREQRDVGAPDHY